MKNLSVIVAACFLLAACQNNPINNSNANNTEQPKLTVAMLATPHDYVCGMDLERDEFVADTTLYEGKIYGFCAPECKTEFLKEPKHYLTQQ